MHFQAKAFVPTLALILAGNRTNQTPIPIMKAIDAVQDMDFNLNLPT